MVETKTADQLAPVRKLEARAKKAAERAELAKARVQAKCKHPYTSLIFREGATTSHELNGDVTHSMRVNCSLCDAWFHNKLVIHRDVY